MLERAVGMGKVAVRVTAEVNSEVVNEQAELYDPTQQVVRSEQAVESSSANGGAGNGGLTGVAGNTPGGEAGGGSSSGNSSETRTETTTNYEIGKTVRSLQRQGGEVKKLSVAVLVEGKTVPAATEGGEATYTPLGENEKNNLRTLVQSAIGFDAGRGDRVEVVDMPFSPPEEAGAVEEPFMTKAQMLGLGQYGLMALALLVVALLVVKPALNVLNAAVLASAPVVVNSGAPGVAGVGMPMVEGGDAMINLASVQGRVRESAVKKVTEIVDQYPEESLGVVRGWMGGNSNARSES
jgi:flagellar M-ring protein FliF